MFWMIVLLILMTGAAFFAVQNSSPVTISFIFWKFESSLAIVIFLSIILGATMSAIVCMISRIKKSFRHPEDTQAISTSDPALKAEGTGSPTEPIQGHDKCEDKKPEQQ